eukprot:gene2609-biopygen1324
MVGGMQNAAFNFVKDFSDLDPDAALDFVKGYLIWIPIIWVSDDGRDAERSLQLREGNTAFNFVKGCDGEQFSVLCAGCASSSVGTQELWVLLLWVADVGRDVERGQFLREGVQRDAGLDPGHPTAPRVVRPSRRLLRDAGPDHRVSSEVSNWVVIALMCCNTPGSDTLGWMPVSWVPAAISRVATLWVTIV